MNMNLARAGAKSVMKLLPCTSFYYSQSNKSRIHHGNLTVVPVFRSLC